MKTARLGRAILVLSGVLAWLIPAMPSRAQDGSHGAGRSNEEAVLRYLSPTLAAAGRGALLYYQGDCQDSDQHSVAFPPVTSQPPPRETGSLSAVREIFGNDKNVTVMEGRSRIITIRIGNAPTAILRTRIAHLNLGKLERDVPSWTIYKLENAKDVEAAMRKLSFKPSPYSPGLVNVVVLPGAPHLPSSMNDVTVEQVLELTAVTFKGVVIYGACLQPQGGTLFGLHYWDVAGPPDPAANTGHGP